MKPMYLKPRPDGTLRLLLSVFTHGEMEDVPANSPYFNQIAPVKTVVELAQEGLFDLDLIARVIKKHLNPKTLRWVNTGGKRPVFVPFGKKSCSAIPEHLYNCPAADPGDENTLIGKPLIAIKDLFHKSTREDTVPVMPITLEPCLDPEDDRKIPGLPVIAKLGAASELTTNSDTLRFTVGRMDKMLFRPMTRLPVPVEQKKLLAVAQDVATSRSPWVYEPPTAIEFETSMLEILEIEKELASTGVPAQVTMLGKRMCVYATDRGNAYCPEVINHKVNVSGYIAGDVGEWGIDRDGSVITKKDDPSNPNLRMAVLYAGPSYILRFQVDGRCIFHKGCAAYFTKIPWYLDVINEHRPNLIKNWEPPPTEEGHAWFFVTSDWCMRNDANIKRNAAGNPAGKATIDLYSRPYLSLKRWVHGPYRAKFRETLNIALPGTTVHKSTVSAADLQNLLDHAAVHGGDQFAGLQQAMTLPKPKKKE